MIVQALKKPLVLGFYSGFGPAGNDSGEEALRSLHAKLTEDAIELFVVGDIQPRAMSPKVQGFVAAQNWFQDTTPLSVNP